jgi:hypothetical protein
MTRVAAISTLTLRATASAIWSQSFAIASELDSCSLRRASK